MDTGPEAKAFADHYILAHMNEASKGQTYEQVSGKYIGLSDAAKASPDGQALGQLRQTLFMGDTLRGLLLYGYAFATIGTIAGIAAIAAFAGAAVLLLLAGLGLWHARRVGGVPRRYPSQRRRCPSPSDRHERLPKVSQGPRRPWETFVMPGPSPWPSASVPVRHQGPGSTGDGTPVSVRNHRVHVTITS